MRFRPRPVKGLTSASEVKGYGRSKGKIWKEVHMGVLFCITLNVVVLWFHNFIYFTITVYYFWKHYHTSQTNKLKDMIYVTLDGSVVSWVISHPLRGLIDLSRYYRNCRNRLNRFGYRRSPHYSLPKRYSRQNKILIIMQAIKGQRWLITIDETLSSSGSRLFCMTGLPCDGFSHVSPIVEQHNTGQKNAKHQTGNTKGVFTSQRKKRTTNTQASEVIFSAELWHRGRITKGICGSPISVPGEGGFKGGYVIPVLY